MLTFIASRRRLFPRAGSTGQPLAPVAAGCLLALAASSTHAQRGTPPPLPPPQFVAITAGASHTCAINNFGFTYCWGLNDTGQAGAASTTMCSSRECVDRPRYVLTAAQVEAGGNHNCALDVSGRAYCWGNDDYGQIGRANGLRDTRVGVTAVAPGLVFSTISAGARSTCGNTNGGVFCWGLMVGGLGSSYPTQLLAYGNLWGISVGDLNACTMFSRRYSNQADCWGPNGAGQVGVPASSTTVPPSVASSFDTNVTRVSVQAGYACADQSTGFVQCLGSNSSGQLGNGNTTNTHLAQTVGGGAIALHGVSAGARHACALDASNQAFCWGDGRWGQLGNGFTSGSTGPPDQSSSPTLVLGGRTYRAIAAGGVHTCAIGTDNHIYCWGSNQFGQIGAQIPQRADLPIGFSRPVQALDP